MVGEVGGVESGDGWAVGPLDAMGDGPGFRKVRTELGVTEFGANAIVIPPGREGRTHWHDRQEELYFVHSGEIDLRLGDEVKRLPAGSLARVAPGTVRQVLNPGEENAVILVVGAHGGYVGHDAHMVDDSDPAKDGQHGEGGANPAEADAQL